MKLAITVTGIALALASCGSTKPKSEIKSVATPVWKCKALSDPDYMTVSILEKDGKLLAKLFEESGDGDEVESDLVEVKAVTSGSIVSFVQLKGLLPSDTSIVSNPSKKTQGFVMQLDKAKEDAITGSIDADVKALVGPTGSQKVKYEVRCNTWPARG